MKKNRIPSTALVPLNPPVQNQTGLPAVNSRPSIATGRLTVTSRPRQSLILERETSAYFGEVDDIMRPRGRGQYKLRLKAEDAFNPGTAPYDHLRRNTEQALDYLLTPQLKRFMRFVLVGIVIIVLAELLAGSGSGGGCAVGVIQRAYPKSVELIN